MQLATARHLFLMTPSEFTAIRDLIHRRTGIYFGEEAVERLAMRLAHGVRGRRSRGSPAPRHHFTLLL